MADQWCDVSHSGLIATAFYFFDDSTVVDCLKTKPGDTVHILFENQYWYCGYISGYSEFTGVIPKSYVHLNQIHQLDMVDSLSYTIYQETSARLKEYLVALFRDYKGPRIERYYSALPLINEIINDRCMLIHETLTAEKNEIKRSVVGLMDKLDSLLDMDKIVRDNDLIRMDFDHPDTSKLFFLYANPKEQEEIFGGTFPDFSNEIHTYSSRKSRSGSVHNEDQLQKKIHNFYIEVKKPDFTANMNYLFTFAICTSEKPIEYLTDHVGFEFKAGKIINGSLTDTALVDSVTALFYNLRASDMFRKLILLGKVYRTGRILEEKKDHDGKRLVCAGAIPLNPFITSDDNEKKSAPESALLNFFNIPSSDYGDIESFLLNKQLKTVVYQIFLKIQHMNGSLSHLRRENPFIFSQSLLNIRPTKFPEVTTQECSQQRCDLYISLKEFFIEKNQYGSKINVSIQVTVHTSHGDLIENCLYTTDDRQPQSYFNSSVTMHSNNPQFCDIFRLSLSDSAMTDCHIRFVFQHLATKIDKEPLTIGYTVLKISDSSTDAIINDGKHSLFVYKLESAASLPEAADYLRAVYNQDSDFAVLSKFSASRVNAKDFFTINTHLVSTGLTTNPNIQALLCYQKRWKIQDYDSVFENLTYVSDPEALRLSSAIIVSSINLTELISIDFIKPLTIILRILALLTGNKRTFYRNIFLKHTHEISAPNFNKKMMINLLLQMDKLEQKNARELVKTFLKSISLLIKIMKICCDQNIQDITDDGSISSDVGGVIFELLMKLCNKFSNLDSGLFVLKIEMMSTIPNVMSECKDLLSLDQLFEILNVLFDNILEATTSEGDQITQQLNLMKFAERFICNLICCDEFSFNKEYRTRVVPFVFEKLRKFKNISSHVSHYFNPMMNLVNFLEWEASNFSEDDHKDIKKILFSNIYLFINNDQVYENKSAKISSLSVVIGFFHVIKAEEFIEFHKNNSNEERLKYIQLLTKFSGYVLRENVIPKNCLVPSIICCHVVVKLFILCCQLSFVENSLIFHRKTHSTVLKLALKVLRYPSLQLELFINDRREHIIHVYGDARIDVIRWLYVLWDRFGDRRCLFYDEFLLKFVQITMIDNPSVRRESLKLIGVTFLKISNDFEALKIAKNIVIDAFDVYLENCPNIIGYISHFIDETKRLVGEIADEEHRKNYAQTATQLNTTLLQLSDYSYGVSADEGSTILKDMCYYINAFYFKSIERYDLFIRNIHKLVSHQVDQHFYLEAGCSLMEHANLLDWCDEVVPSTDEYPEEKEYTRKANIMMQAIDMISKENEYDLCIEIAKQLYPIYDLVFMDYNMASKLLKNMAIYYHSVVNDVRCCPAYFCVGFYGQKFHLAIRNKRFIHRGKNFMKLGDLIKNLKTNFPHAKVSGIATEINDELINSDKLIIFCSGVTPVPEDSRVLDNTYASEQIKSYYQLNQTTKFSMQRPIIATEDVKNKWVEETTYITQFMLPGPLNWAEIVEIVKRKISPIEIAVADVLKKTHALTLCASKVESSPAAHISELSSLLNGIIDSAVNGGTSKYAEAFLVEAYLKESPQDSQLVKQLSDALVEQYKQTRIGLALHEQFADVKFYGLHYKMVTMFEDMHTSTELYCKVSLEKFITAVTSSLPPGGSEHGFDSSSLTYKTIGSTLNRSGRPRKDSASETISSMLSAAHIGEGRPKSGSITSSNEQVETECAVGTVSGKGSKTKSKIDQRKRSCTNSSIGSISKRARKSFTANNPHDPSKLQNLFIDPKDEKLNTATPFIMDEGSNSTTIRSSNAISSTGSLRSQDNTNSSTQTTSRSKNRFRLRIDKIRNRSRSNYQDE